MLTDGGVFDPDGRLMALGSKCWAFPHLKMAVSFRGQTIFVAPVIEEIGRLGGDYDEVRERLPTVFRESYERQIAAARALFAAQGQTIPPALGLEYDVIVVGWSKAKGSDIYAISNYDRGDGIAPWEVADLAPVAPLPSTDLMMDKLKKTSPDLIGIEKYCRIVGDEWRKINFSSAGGEPVYLIGGFLQLTTVGPELITTRIIHRWPDKIGDRILSVI